MKAHQAAVPTRPPSCRYTYGKGDDTNDWMITGFRLETYVSVNLVGRARVQCGSFAALGRHGQLPTECCSTLRLPCPHISKVYLPACSMHADSPLPLSVCMQTVDMGG